MSDTGDQPDTLREQRLNEAILRVTELTDAGEPFQTEQLLEGFADVSEELREFIDDHQSSVVAQAPLCQTSMERNATITSPACGNVRWMICRREVFPSLGGIHRLFRFSS